MGAKINFQENIEMKMEELRDILNALIQRNPDDYLKTEIIQISTQLDALILKYIRKSIDDTF
ncbi:MULTISPECIES: Spo0E family sporulation regulatory protein-aspartic acid phosphatase [Clostridium]|uniref:Spo0E family sporulation regulatory protein-aspartic acid phosphatase n=1 Tax=Clostridium frigoriphilum TaxID=443253 RepID=A0ABU7UIX4_9CLOT|nr:Spo0E family sporulation regulatory protein-aspartic acid phosphatase [Clostridium sp. DSM 17811]MBU3098274.1 Spo0E family sporulation regulatory protein-aspartic acid phosphatase [Clostridium sp. DSM 17811]